MADANTPERRTYLVSRSLDFWLLGGGSILIYLFMILGSEFRGLYGVSNQFGNLAVTMATMSLLINYPHFLASYRLAYGRGKQFILKHWFQTIVMPCLMLNFLIIAYWFVNEPGHKETCELMLGAGINFMYFTVGWHYSKQAFGCTMVYAAYDRYPLNRIQRESIRYSLLSMWWYNYAYNNLNPSGVFWSLKYTTWQVSFRFYHLTQAIFFLLLAWTLYRVVYCNWKAGQRPSPTLLVPYLAVLVWFAPCFRQPDFFFYMVPFFHSLQYLTFVYRVERSNLALRQSSLHASMLVLGLLLSGWIAFEFIPGNLDQVFDNLRTFGFSFFLIAANLFINIHHYFLDNILWRVGDDKVVRAALLN